MGCDDTAQRSIVVDSELGPTYNSDEVLPPAPKGPLSCGERINMGTRIDTTLNTGRPTDSREIYKIIEEVAGFFHIYDFEKLGPRSCVAIHRSFPENEEDVICRYLAPNGVEYTVVVVGRCVRVYRYSREVWTLSCFST